MSKGKSSGRKTQRIVRAPATKFGHLQKKAKSVDGAKQKSKKRKS
jgi:hypothetical protein